MNEFARIGFNSGSFYFAYILRWKLLDQSITGNYSKVKLQASIYVGANYINWTWGKGNLHGSEFNLASKYSKGETVVASKDITVKHDANGNASIYISGSISSSYVMNGSCGGTISLPKIDRSAPNISLSIPEIKENSITIRYAVNVACDSVQARLNSGTWFSIEASPTIINDLSEETTYSIQLRAKKTSNQVWGNSSSISFKTLAGTFAFISKNGSSFKAAETYIIENDLKIKLSKDQYKSLIGG